MKSGYQTRLVFFYFICVFVIPQMYLSSNFVHSFNSQEMQSRAAQSVETFDLKVGHSPTKHHSGQKVDICEITKL